LKLQANLARLFVDPAALSRALFAANRAVVPKEKIITPNIINN
jgi:hypothetical protein